MREGVLQWAVVEGVLQWVMVFGKRGCGHGARWRLLSLSGLTIETAEERGSIIMDSMV